MRYCLIFVSNEQHFIGVIECNIFKLPDFAGGNLDGFCFEPFLAKQFSLDFHQRHSFGELSALLEFFKLFLGPVF